MTSETDKDSQTLAPPADPSVKDENTTEDQDSNSQLSPNEPIGDPEDSIFSWSKTVPLLDWKLLVDRFEILREAVEYDEGIKEHEMRVLVGRIPFFAQVSDDLEWHDKWSKSLSDRDLKMFLKVQWQKVSKLIVWIMSRILAMDQGLSVFKYDKLSRTTTIKTVSNDRSFRQWVWYWISLQPNERFKDIGDGFNHRLIFPTLGVESWKHLFSEDPGRFYSIAKELLICYPHDITSERAVYAWSIWMMDLHWVLKELYKIFLESESDTKPELAELADIADTRQSGSIYHSPKPNDRGSLKGKGRDTRAPVKTQRSPRISTGRSGPPRPSKRMREED